MTQPRIVIVDYDVGNTRSVWNAIAALGYRKLRISAAEQDIAAADALVLPGVGAFGACADNLRRYGLEGILTEAVMVKKKPILGICVGMQLMASSSEENGLHAGLDWIPGHVRKLDLPPGFPIPHVGWNDLQVQRSSALFARTGRAPNFYFDHSYHYCCDPQYVSASCDYGVSVVAAIQRENIFGVQFHPEKSQTSGLKLFRGFFEAIRAC
ncbi:MAG: imidazole glycerol phosphate synthase, glutamine amidotransferase subunit [Gammaproteobacteria bacterium RIFOXYA12_FULL_61_12]|nr:MAG: imidazole glycerol phosphate synthase, glutamine amidotransferase subunit [Gammaproteobacteria bacterium RIFOXYD12_FULL_61_37]OGT94677.1 MAG: imidazole glycerol phosphate synthase, glutamine amidotransferase subunit [Gammaproteobacteria bacterium RIFOXYA12_FULL_61_12]